MSSFLILCQLQKAAIGDGETVQPRPTLEEQRKAGQNGHDTGLLVAVHL